MRKLLFLIFILSAFLLKAQPEPVNIFPEPIIPNSSLEVSQKISFNNNLYFVARRGIDYSWELWRTNGYLSGTYKIKSLSDGPPCNNGKLTTTKSKIYFSAFDSTAGVELWMSDGTASGTIMLKDINPGNVSSCISSLTAMGDTLFFIADDGVHGNELWMSDGTPTGTKMVIDIDTVPVSGSGLNAILPLSVIDGVLYFYANNFYNGLELWRSDGSALGTYMIKDINPGSATSGYYYDKMFQVGNKFFFTANDGVHGNEPWVSDGTPTGTYLVKDIHPGTSSSNPITFLNNIGDSLIYFRANDGLYGTEFWRSDGTSTGTYMLKDFNVGPGNGEFSSLIELNNEWFIPAKINSSYGWELYKTNVLVNALTLVKDINPGAGDSKAAGGIVFDNLFYFGADDGTHGDELWVSDGTAPGTNLVKDIQPGTANSFRGFFIIFDNKLYFNAGLPPATVGTGALWKMDTCKLMTVTGTTDSITGSVSINVAGGAQPYYRYIWSNGDTTQNVSGLFSGTYTVTVIDNAGCTTNQSFYLNSTVSIPEISFVKPVLIHPNPSSGIFTITPGLCRFDIYNMLGEKISYPQISHVNSTAQADLSYLPEGVYFLVFSTEEGSYTKKLIIAK